MNISTKNYSGAKDELGTKYDLQRYLEEVHKNYSLEDMLEVINEYLEENVDVPCRFEVIMDSEEMKMYRNVDMNGINGGE